jgi:hypothetical protein
VNAQVFRRFREISVVFFQDFSDKAFFELFHGVLELDAMID